MMTMDVAAVTYAAVGAWHTTKKGRRWVESAAAPRITPAG